MRQASFLRNLLTSLLLFGPALTQATHIIGGEMYYDDLGNGQYTITVKLYRDCTGAVFDPVIQVGMYQGATNQFSGSFSIPFPGGSFIPVELDNPCLTLPPDICIQTTSYVTTLPLGPIPEGGLILSFQRCCRTGFISNLPTPGSLGITVMCRIPGPEEASANSSPRFIELPPVALCLNEPLVFDHSAFDPDGDQLVYELCTPFNGGSLGDAQPTPSTNTQPPYAFLPWGAGYSESYPIDSSPAIAIDPVTGLLTLTPTQIGFYTVGVCVSEYRNGMLLSTTRREFLFQVVPCNAEVVAAVVAQQNSQFCAGLTMNFMQSSFGASTYHWDFGDPGTQADTSNVYAPTWTYAAPGTYTVTLVANPGLVCADTATAVFQVHFNPEPFFESPEPTCGPSNALLVVEGQHFGPGANVLWDLGPGLSPSTGIGPQVSADVSVGVHPVTVNVLDNGCAGSFTANVVVHQVPTASFYFDPPSPQLAGTTVNLYDQSSGNGAAINGWVWSANGMPMASGPQYQWTNTYPGDYAIQLVITTSEGCTDTIMGYYTITAGDIIIPNVFTPNGDGINDFFVIENAQFLPNTLRVYNRWGQVVYETTNYRNTWRGSDLPDGTYYYVFALTDGKEHAGHVTLLR